MLDDSVEDAIILHLIYFLGINQSILSFLKFDPINKNKSITYYDTIYLVRLNESWAKIFKDILYFKEYKY